MDVYLAYFDLLGYKEFIENNTQTQIQKRIDHILTYLGIALKKANPDVKYKQNIDGSKTPDFNESNLNVLNFSDTIIIWTNDTSRNALNEILQATYHFNYYQVVYNFPIRGALIKGEIDYLWGSNIMNKGRTHTIANIYGKGILEAYKIAESLQISGTILDDSVFNSGLFDVQFSSKFIKKFDIEHKENGTYKTYERNVFKLIYTPANKESIINTIDKIRNTFSSDNKSTSDKGVQRKLKNTISFLNSHID